MKTISVSLDKSRGYTTVKPKQPPRPLLQLPSGQWPGAPGTRSIMAAMDYTESDVQRVFLDNPSSQWIITPYEVIERRVFFAPKPAPIFASR